MLKLMQFWMGCGYTGVADVRCDCGYIGWRYGGVTDFGLSCRSAAGANRSF